MTRVLVVVSNPNSDIIPTCAEIKSRLRRNSSPCHQTAQTGAAPAGGACSDSGHALGSLRGHPLLQTLGYSWPPEVGYCFSLAGLGDPLP